ncbi:MAG: hypothetical protein RR879_07135 [Hydrogenoanaerobacterium sp.]
MSKSPENKKSQAPQSSSEDKAKQPGNKTNGSVNSKNGNSSDCTSKADDCR